MVAPGAWHTQWGEDGNQSFILDLGPELLHQGPWQRLEALPLAVPAFAGADAGHSNAQWLHFAGVVTSVAILCSILGNALWNLASRALPLTLMARTIVFETLFASLYGFLWEERWPSGLEWAAMLLRAGGVLACARAHARPGHG